MESLEILQVLFLLSGVLVIAVLALLVWVFRLSGRVKRLLAGKDARSLEDTIASHSRDIAELSSAREKIEQYLAFSHEKQKKNISRVETIRFNPFRGDGSGGNQSFVTALSDEEGDGVILSCLYARDRVSVYAKPLKKFTSERELSEEERTAVENIKNKK